MPIFQASGGGQQQQNNDHQNDQPPQKGRVKSVLRYTTMPEILPRIRALGFHFGHFAYLLAIIFGSARLINRNHPVMNAANMGQYGIREVIAIAANNLTWSRNNIDQIAIFAAIVIGLIMIIIQAGLIALAALSGFGNEASAQGFFSPGGAYNPAEDPMMVFFAQVFGDLDGFWGDGVAPNAPGINSGIQIGIHKMLSFYSMAMMVIAMIIIIYFIMIVVAEAAKTGTPFGNRFDSLWAPVRLCIALGLLVPLGSGLNSAQYLTLFVAKTGSGLGTNIWNVFGNHIVATDPDAYEVRQIDPNWIRDIAAKIFIMEICAAAYEKYNPGQLPIFPLPTTFVNDAASNTHKATYTYTNNNTANEVKCGEINLQMQKQDQSYIAKDIDYPTEEIFDAFVSIIVDLTTNNTIKAKAAEYAASVVSVGGRTDSEELAALFDSVMAQADAAAKSNLDAANISQSMEKAFVESVDKAKEQIEQSWVYAGGWYIELSRLMQIHSSYVRIGPEAVIGFSDLNTGNSTEVVITRRGRRKTVANYTNEVQEAMDAVFEYYNNYGYYEKVVQVDLSDFSCFDFVSERSTYSLPPLQIGGMVIEGLKCSFVYFLIPHELIKLADPAHKNLDPLGTLLSAGEIMLDRAEDGIIIGFGMQIPAKLQGIMDRIPIIGGLAPAAASFGTIVITAALLGLGVGFILFYFVPLMPFIYFFFAILSWMMEIFEAIVAMPLWALAHLRIDKDQGMMGQAASGGYYLLLMILMRPALIVIFLIGAVVIYSGAVYLLQTMFASAVGIKSFEPSGVETTAHAVIFAFLTYSIGITCFKLVDAGPSGILRWIGSNPGTFTEQRDDPMDKIMQGNNAAAAIIGTKVVGTISEALKPRN